MRSKKQSSKFQKKKAARQVARNKKNSIRKPNIKPKFDLKTLVNTRDQDHMMRAAVEAAVDGDAKEAETDLAALIDEAMPRIISGHAMVEIASELIEEGQISYNDKLTEENIRLIDEKTVRWIEDASVIVRLIQEDLPPEDLPDLMFDMLTLTMDLVGSSYPEILEGVEEHKDVINATFHTFVKEHAETQHYPEMYLHQQRMQKVGPIYSTKAAEPA